MVNEVKKFSSPSDTMIEMYHVSVAEVLWDRFEEYTWYYPLQGCSYGIYAFSADP